jgi:hypothetical protein
LLVEAHFLAHHCLALLVRLFILAASLIFLKS